MIIHMKKVTKYDPTKIESKWQKKWQADKIYRIKEDPKKPSLTSGKDKFYVLDMFPYPSGEGLHVGHPKGYIATDIISRMNRMQGKSVLHPMGFDAFGLPAENYALKTKTNPADSVKKNVERYKKQLEILGFDYDWSREINTTDSEYYRWTQWIFLQMYKKGLAYESNEPINWCPSCKTGLANEDVEDGRCERCGTPVEKKPLRQWVLKITDYAERLLADLDAQKEPEIPLFVRKDGPDAVRKDMPLVERHPIVCIVKHWKEDKYIGLNWKANHWQGFVTGGVEDGESKEQAAIREIQEETGYQNIKFIREVGRVDSQFYQAVKKVNRFAHFTIIYLELVDDKHVEVSEAEKKLHDVVWVPKNEMDSFITHDDVRYVWNLFVGREKQESKPLLDWPNSIKEAQRNWIGKSEGAEIDFKIKNSDKKIKVFTTRPDTLFGVTYVVLAPEHAYVQELLSSVENKAEVEAYIAQAKLETEIERTDAKKEKTGVELKGVKAINPANSEEVPVWIADYVLADYGTGAVMAVPAHDERDWDFAKKFGLEVKNVVLQTVTAKSGIIAFHPNEPIVYRNVIRAVVKHWSEDKYIVLTWRDNGLKSFISGGIEGDEDAVEAAKREILEETGYSDLEFVSYIGGKVCARFYAPNKNQNREDKQQGILFKLKSDKRVDISVEEQKIHTLDWMSLDDAKKVMDPALVDFVIVNRLGINNQAYTGEGILIDSDKFTGKSSESIKKDITLSVGGNWVTKYKLRDWVFSRQRYWGEPIPLIHCKKCGVVPVPEKDLPVKLPKVKSYEPTGTGESPLADIHKWVNVKCPKCRGIAKRETNTMPQWAGSSWYYLRYMDPKNKKALVDPKKEAYWEPVDMYVGGAEHATRHLIYARFWHKFLYDIGVVSTIEPFIKLQHVGLIMGEDGRKMSKRFGNVVNPDDIVKAYGADTMRVYEMFMGPFDQQIAWSTSSMVGSRRFIEKVWRLQERIMIKDSRLANSAVDKLLHKTIKKVTADIHSMSFNTAISTLMITVNEIEKLANNETGITRSQFEILLQLLAPFAPHMTEELWKSLGNKTSIHISPWPVCDESQIIDDEVNIIVQVNGKVRASFKAQKDLAEAEIEATAKAIPEVSKWLEGKSIKKVIVIKNKLVSIVVS
jgi:leucyl-tRNA synthetase